MGERKPMDINVSLPEGFKFHHLGTAVKEFAPAVRIFSALGYECSEPIRDDEQQAETIWCSSSRMPPVELIRPTSPDSPVATILTKYGESIYHMGFAVKDVAVAEKWLIDELKARPVREARPATRFEQRLVAFYYVVGAGVIELVTEP